MNIYSILVDIKRNETKRFDDIEECISYIIDKVKPFYAGSFVMAGYQVDGKIIGLALCFDPKVTEENVTAKKCDFIIKKYHTV